MKLDLSNRSLRKIETNLIATASDEYIAYDVIDEVIFDNNSINKLENLDQYTQLKQVFIYIFNIFEFLIYVISYRLSLIRGFKEGLSIALDHAIRNSVPFTYFDIFFISKAFIGKQSSR
jgi:hypothetical protein